MMRCLLFVMLLSCTTLSLAQDRDVLRASAADAQEPAISAGEHAALRNEARERPRRIIMNNDGDDAGAYRYGRGEPPPDETLIEDFLDYRAPREGSQVDTVFYSTDRGSFGIFSHRTEVGTMHSERHIGGGHNLVPRMRAMGTDPLAEYIKHCRERDIEIFWSMRMNDSHDVNREEHRLSGFKRENPEFMFATRGERTPHGYWTGVDYARDEVREFLYRVFAEVVENYDIDGIEMDFLRHLQLFRSVAMGGTASDEERDKLTGLIRRVRQMLDEAGMRRGRPFLLAVRTPDSVGFCRDMGMDIERWLELGLVDMLITSGFFRLNDWEYSVELGRAHGIPVYPAFEETRVMGQSGCLLRSSLEAYRGRAWEAWEAGFDGIYTFNLFNTDLPHFWELGSPETLRGKDRYHFIAVRNGEGRIRRALSGGMDYRKRQVLTPDSPPAIIRRTAEAEYVFKGIYDSDPAAGAGSPEVECRVLAPDVQDPGRLEVLFNGEVLPIKEAAEGWLRYNVDPGLLQPGANRVRLRLAGDYAAPGEDDWDMVYRGEYVMQMPQQLPWRRLISGADIEEIRGEALYMADLGTGERDKADRFYPWQVEPGEEIVVQARVKVESSSAPKAVTVRVADGAGVEYLTLEEDKIGLFHAGVSHSLDTTADFHTYRITVKGEDIRVYVDGEPVLDGTGAFTTAADDESRWLPLSPLHSHWNRKSLMFGSASGPGTGAAYWDYIGYRMAAPKVIIRDLMLSVHF